MRYVVWVERVFDRFEARQPPHDKVACRLKRPKGAGLRERWSRPRVGWTVAALTVVTLIPAPALASLWVEFHPDRGRVGETIRGQTLGSGSVTSAAGMELPLFLLPRDAKHLEGVEDERLTRIGSLSVDAQGDGLVAFRVPDLKAGRYRVLIHCEPCAPASGGRELLPAGLFSVEKGSASTPTAVDRAPSGGSSERTLTWILLAAGALLLIAVTVRATRRAG